MILPSRNDGSAARPTGELAVFLCRNGGDQMRDSELADDRTGDEAVGGRDDGAQGATVEMPANQRAVPARRPAAGCFGKGTRAARMSSKARGCAPAAAAGNRERRRCRGCRPCTARRTRCFWLRTGRGRESPCRSGTAPIQSRCHRRSGYCRGRRGPDPFFAFGRVSQSPRSAEPRATSGRVIGRFCSSE
jgi:hypothetical protein